MDSTLAQLFQRSRGAPIDYQGWKVHAIFERQIESQQIIHMRLESSREHPQGVCIKIVKGTLLINAQQLNQAVIWTETAPPSLRIVCQPKGKATLKIWNTWKYKAGIMNAWIGNSGMLVDSSPEQVQLRCSDGTGEVSFDALTVWLRFESPASTDLAAK